MFARVGTGMCEPSKYSRLKERKTHVETITTGNGKCSAGALGWPEGVGEQPGSRGFFSGCDAFVTGGETL